MNSEDVNVDLTDGVVTLFASKATTEEKDDVDDTGKFVICIHKNITYIHTHILTFIHIYIHMLIYTYVVTYTDTRIHTYLYTHEGL